MQATAQRNWITIGEAARLAQVGTSTIDRAERRGELVVYAGIPTGRLFHREEVKAWAKARAK